MIAKQIIAMLLAGGQGSRLGVLTSDVAKPAVPFGGKYRIIDFPLSNCANSRIDTVGVLTQYQPLELNNYIGNGAPWDLDRNAGGAYVLPPYVRGKKGEWYSGTANAIYQNISFIEQYSPKYVLILSGDHIYKMDYGAMLKYHIEKQADATIAVIPVPIEEAGRFGIMSSGPDGRITEFEEKPENPTSNEASMGIYIFTWEVLKRYLISDTVNPESHQDFGQDIIPAMLKSGQRMFAYRFTGYWKDVGTVESLWEANMDLLEDPARFDLYDPSWRIYCRNPVLPPHFVGEDATIVRSIVTEGCEVYGNVAHSVLFSGVVVEKGATVVDSVVMPGAVIKKGARVFKAILAENSVVGENSTVGELNPGGEPDNGGIAVVGEGCEIFEGVHIASGRMVSHADCETMRQGGAK